MTNKQQFDLFVKHASLAFFASAWAVSDASAAAQKDMLILMINGQAPWQV